MTPEQRQEMLDMGCPEKDVDSPIKRFMWIQKEQEENKKTIEMLRDELDKLSDGALIDVKETTEKVAAFVLKQRERGMDPIHALMETVVKMNIELKLLTGRIYVLEGRPEKLKELLENMAKLTDPDPEAEEEEDNA